MPARSATLGQTSGKGAPLYRDFRHTPIVIDHGDGVYLFDQEGKAYLDGGAGAAVCGLGHGHPEIVDSIRKQSEKLTYVHLSHFASDPLMELAGALVETAPANIERASFVSGGSEANETAIKIAHQYHRARGQSSKYKVISRYVSYHGATLGVLSLSGQVVRRRAFAPLLPDIAQKVAPAYCYRCPFGQTPDACALECADDLERVILHEGPENVSAFIAEPVSGASAPGVYPPDDYWRRIRDICDRYDVLLIVDEVMSGVGRTGQWWAIQHSGVEPDMITSAKGLGAGYTPIGATLLSGEISDALARAERPFVHGFTYGGNPLSCAVAARVLEVMGRDDLVSQAQAKGDRLLTRLRNALGDHPHVGEIRGRGLLLGVEFVADKTTREPFPTEADVRSRLSRACLQQGLYLYPGGGSANGAKGDHVLIAPPLVIDDTQIDDLVEKLAAAVRMVFDEETL